MMETFVGLNSLRTSGVDFLETGKRCTRVCTDVVYSFMRFAMETRTIFIHCIINTFVWSIRRPASDWGHGQTAGCPSVHVGVHRQAELVTSKIKVPPVHHQPKRFLDPKHWNSFIKPPLWKLHYVHPRRARKQNKAKQVHSFNRIIYSPYYCGCCL